MRFPLTLFWMSLGLLFLAPDHTTGGLKRRKRFLSHDSWAGIPDRLDEIFSRASQRISARLTPLQVLLNIDRSPITEETADDLRPAASSNSDREVETEDSDAEVVPVEKDKRPQRPGILFPFDFFTPWWSGPNICTERSELEENVKDVPDLQMSLFGSGFMEFSQCSPSESSYTCTRRIIANDTSKTLIIKKQCCHGFKRRSDLRPGCEPVEMDDVLQTLKNVEVSKFAEIVESMSLAEKLKTENFTIFAPINQAIVDYEEEMESNEILAVRPSKNKDMSYFVGGHVVDGFVNIDHLEDEITLPAVNGRTTIRINKYPKSVITANCIPVTQKNTHATNGYVHLVSNILPLPRKSVGDIIAGSPQFRVFSKLLDQSGLQEDLEDSMKAWTIFAPSDAAFKKMDQELLRKLESGEGCLESILHHHMVKGTICASAVSGQSRVRNVLGKSLKLSRDESEKVTINDARANVTDLVGTNGVVHIIDEVLIPSEARDMMEVLKEAKREDMIKLIKAADLEKTIDDMRNVTFFVPSKEAIENIPEEIRKRWKENPDELQEVLLYHLSRPKTMMSSFVNTPELDTLAGSKSIHVQLHGMLPVLATAATAQCGRIINGNNEACGAVLHVVDKVLTPPKPSIYGALKSSKNHEILLKLLESTELEKTLQGKGIFTLLAPTDEAFERFSKKSLDELYENKTKAEQILKMHVLPEMLCCSGVYNSFPFRHQFVRTMEGNLLSVHRNRYERVHFGPARAVKCEAGMAENGVIHSINKVLLPSRSPVFEFDIFRLF